MNFYILGRIVWGILAVGWYILRYPHERRVKKMKLSVDRKPGAERRRLALSITGIGVIPVIYAVTGFPAFADRPAWPLAFWLGTIVAAAALVMFHLTHKALGRMWSVSLQLKEDHKLVTEGVYARVRHPMYSAFWLMAIAQALLLPNWIAGFTGILAFGFLFFARVGPEERMMEEAFGDEWRAYVAQTRRIIPGIW